MTSCAVLVSGGPDSAVLVARMLRRHRPVVPIYVQQGLAWERAERYWLARWLVWFPRRQVASLVTLALPIADVYRRHWSVTGAGVPRAADPDAAVLLPGRNVLLVAKAAVYCAQRRIGTIAVGTLKGNPFPDAQPAFRRAFSRALTLGLGRPLRIIAPLASRTKVQVSRAGQAMRLPLELTFSCIDPRGRLHRAHCGRCQKCGERRQAFRAAGFIDPTRYTTAS